MTTERRAAMLLGSVSDADVHRLARLLAGPYSPVFPTTAWLHDQAHLITTLPPAVLRPTSSFQRWAVKLRAARRAVLCHAHDDLHPVLIRGLFLLVAAEVTKRIERFQKHHHHLPPPVQAFVRRMLALNALWMGAQRYRDSIQPGRPAFARVKNNCEACILAVIGGNVDAVVDLRASLLGRKKRGRPHPRLMTLVEAWIEGTGRRDELCHRSSALGKEVRGCRRQLYRARREQRRHRHTPPPPPYHAPPKSSFEAPLDDIRGHHVASVATIGIYLDPSLAAAEMLPQTRYSPPDGDVPSECPSLDHDGASAPEDEVDEGGDEYGDDAPLLARDDEPDHEHDVEGSIISFYARKLSTLAGFRAQSPPAYTHEIDPATTDDEDDERGLHPAFTPRPATSVYSRVSGMAQAYMPPRAFWPQPPPPLMTTSSTSTSSAASAAPVSAADVAAATLRAWTRPHDPTGAAETWAGEYRAALGGAGLPPYARTLPQQPTMQPAWQTRRQQPSPPRIMSSATSNTHWSTLYKP